jgi:hypothetical protein
MRSFDDKLTIEDYEQVLADHRRLVRELDIAMHGEEGAAQQASLCDLIKPARELREAADNFGWVMIEAASIVSAEDLATLNRILTQIQEVRDA